MTYILFLLAALFLTNGVPHFVKGVTGEKHMTPFGKPSGAVVNVLWGSANFYLGFWLLRWALDRTYAVLSASLAVIVGVVLIGLLLAFMWQHDTEAKGK